MTTAHFVAKFPVYALAFDPNTLTLLLGGGGGPSRSGLQNGVLILRHCPSATESTGTAIKSQERAPASAFTVLGELSTGEEAVTAIDLSTEGLVSLGVNDRCWLLELETHHHAAQHQLHLLRTVQADFSPTDDGYLKFVRFSVPGSNGSDPDTASKASVPPSSASPTTPTLNSITSSSASLLTGGTEGCAREYTAPELKLLRSIRPHSDTATATDTAIDALVDGDAWHCNETAIVAAASALQITCALTQKAPGSSDRIAIVLAASAPRTFRHIRILSGPHTDSDLHILAVLNPSKASSGLAPAIAIYNARTGKQQGRITALPFARNCTALATVPGFMAFGFADGSLLVVERRGIAPDMNRILLKTRQAHPFPVTGVAIDVRSRCLISVSADGVLLSHSIPSHSVSPWPRSAIGILLAIILPLLLAVALRRNRADELADFDAFYQAIAQAQAQAQAPHQQQPRPNNGPIL